MRSGQRRLLVSPGTQARVDARIRASLAMQVGVNPRTLDVFVLPHSASSGSLHRESVAGVTVVTSTHMVPGQVSKWLIGDSSQLRVLGKKEAQIAAYQVAEKAGFFNVNRNACPEINAVSNTTTCRRRQIPV
jgi:hypothetical protein